MRYVEITHVYILPVPQDQEEGLDMVVNEGVSIMESVIQNAARSIRGIRTDWKIMPKEFSLSDEVIQGDGDRDTDEMTITPALQSVKRSMGVRHPWDDKVRVLPVDHPFAIAETHALEVEGLRCPVTSWSERGRCALIVGHDGDHNYQLEPTSEELERAMLGISDGKDD